MPKARAMIARKCPGVCNDWCKDASGVCHIHQASKTDFQNVVNFKCSSNDVKVAHKYVYIYIYILVVSKHKITNTAFLN